MCYLVLSDPGWRHGDLLRGVRAVAGVLARVLLLAVLGPGPVVRVAGVAAELQVLHPVVVLDVVLHVHVAEVGCDVRGPVPGRGLVVVVGVAWVEVGVVLGVGATLHPLPLLARLLLRRQRALQHRARAGAGAGRGAVRRLRAAARPRVGREELARV